MATKIFVRVAAWALFPRRTFASALFVSDRSTKVRPILTPTLNLAAKFDNLEKLENNLKARGIDTDAPGLKTLWEFHNSLDETRDALEKRRVEIAGQMKDLKQVGGKEADAEAEKLRLEGRILREDLKNLLQAFWEVEEKMMVSCLALPNDLHSRTPLGEDKLLSQYGNSPKERMDHLVAGKDLIDYRSSHWYYLKNDAAVFDLALMNYFHDSLKTAGFSPMIPPDFSHAAVVEGCGTNPENSLRLQPSEENMHLVGGASLFTCSAYYAKQTLPFKYLPCRHVVCGKKYGLADGPGLFGAWQRTSVDVFALTFNADDLDSLLDVTLNKVTSLYTNLGWEFRVIYTAAPNLKPWESFRVSFQMFSGSCDKWVEVGCLSLSGTFISERLSIAYEDNDQSIKFCHILSGNVVDVTLVLACLLEQGTKQLFPSPLAPYLFNSVQIM